MFRQVGTSLAVGAALVITSSSAVAAARHASHAPAAVAGAADHGGPFGIFIGEPIADLGPVKAVQPGVYIVLHPARPNSLFDQVGVDAFPGMGVCQIVGVTGGYEFDNQGNLARASADKITQILTAKYGPAVKTDTCDGSDVECGDGWAEAVREKNAEYDYQWDFSKNPRPDKIGQIDVMVYGDNAALTHVEVAYFSADSDACEDAKKSAAAGSL